MDASSEKYSLLWEDFQQNASRSFAELREDKNFCDVTLVCNDNQQVVAHRAVLVSCSSILFSVLRSNSHPHPMIFLWGVQFEQLKAVLDFCCRAYMEFVLNLTQARYLKTKFYPKVHKSQ